MQCSYKTRQIYGIFLRATNVLINQNKFYRKYIISGDIILPKKKNTSRKYIFRNAMSGRYMPINEEAAEYLSIYKGVAHYEKVNL